MSLIFVLLGAVGAILSVFKNRWCFVVWIPCNLYWIWFNWPSAQSWVFLIMSWSCLFGWRVWSNDKAAGDAMLMVTIKRLGRENLRLRSENKTFHQAWTLAQDRIIELKGEIEQLCDICDCGNCEPCRKKLRGIFKGAEHEK